MRVHSTDRHDAADERHVDQSARGITASASRRFAASAICTPSRAHRTVTAMLLAPPGPPVTEVVPVRIHGHDSSWPPVLVFCVLVVVLGSLFAAIMFLRSAKDAGRPPRGPLDG